MAAEGRGVAAEGWGMATAVSSACSLFLSGDRPGSQKSHHFPHRCLGFSKILRRAF